MPARGPPMAEAVVENRRLRRPEPEPALDQLGPETRVDRVFPRPALMRTIVRRDAQNSLIFVVLAFLFLRRHFLTSSFGSVHSQPVGSATPC